MKIFRFRLTQPLRSIPITELLRYYGLADSLYHFDLEFRNYLISLSTLSRWSKVSQSPSDDTFSHPDHIYVQLKPFAPKSY